MTRNRQSFDSWGTKEWLLNVIFLISLIAFCFMLYVSGDFGQAVLGFIVAFIIGAIYMSPTYVAIKRKHRQAAAIAALNICLGWTTIGWVVALVWAFYQDRSDFQAATAEDGERDLGETRRKWQIEHDGAVVDDKRTQQERRNTMTARYTLMELVNGVIGILVFAVSYFNLVNGHHIAILGCLIGMGVWWVAIGHDAFKEELEQKR